MSRAAGEKRGHHVVRPLISSNPLSTRGRQRFCRAGDSGRTAPPRLRNRRGLRQGLIGVLDSAGVRTRTQTGTVLRVMRDRSLVMFTSNDREPSKPVSCCSGTIDATAAESREVEVENLPHAVFGDRVDVLMPEPRGLGARLAALLPAFLLPIAGALAGGMVGGDMATGIGVGAGLAIGAVGTVVLSRRMSADPRYRARVLRIVDSGYRAGPCQGCGPNVPRR